MVVYYASCDIFPTYVPDLPEKPKEMDISLLGFWISCWTEGKKKNRDMSEFPWNIGKYFVELFMYSVWLHENIARFGQWTIPMIMYLLDELSRKSCGE